MDSQFSIKIKTFEGPLDLLLQLIEKRKMHISEISLSQVTEDYINHINNLENIPKKQMADFLIIASTLMMIKSASLLPEAEDLEEEDNPIEELEERLKIYDKLRKITNHLDTFYKKNIIFFKKYKPKKLVNFNPSDDLNINSISESMTELVGALPMPKEKEVSIKKVATLEETINKIISRVSNNLSITLSQKSPQNKSEKIDMIMTFLGMLELVKNGFVEVSQNNHFQDIQITKSQTD